MTKNFLTKLISVIVPIYNVEKYLYKCLDSILSQTYSNLEVILVDDGSPDNCPRICDEYAKRDTRIKVVHKENGGLSDARNAGIDASSGDYICFIDSDDTIDMDMIKLLYESLTKENSDVALCKLNIVSDKGEKKLYDEVNINQISSETIASLFIKNDSWHEKNRIVSNGLTWSACRAMYSRKIVGDTRFIKNMISEDFFFNLEVIKKCKKISVVDKGLYNYYQRENSIVRSYNKSKLMKRIEFSKAALATVKGLISCEEYNSFSFYLYECCVIECVRAKNTNELFKIIKSDTFLLSLNNFKNCRYRIKSISSPKEKLSCLLLVFKLLSMYKFLYLKHKSKR